MKRECSVSKESYAGITGTKSMGRAHSNAFIAVCYFFELPLRPVLRTAWRTCIPISTMGYAASKYLTRRWNLRWKGTG
jgi:hypothetical protein